MTVQADPNAPPNPAIPPQQPTPQEPSPAPPAEPGEKTIPYARFKEINDKLKALEAKETERTEADRLAAEAKQKAEGKLQELLDAKEQTIAELQPKAALAAELETFVNDGIAAEIKEWPDELKAMDPGAKALSARMAWAQKARPLAAKFSTVTAKPGNGRDPKPAGSAVDAKADEVARAADARRYGRR